VYDTTTMQKDAYVKQQEKYVVYYGSASPPQPHFHQVQLTCRKSLQIYFAMGKYRKFHKSFSWHL